MHRVRIGRVVTIGAAVCTGVALTALLGVVAAVAVEDHGATCFPTQTGEAQVGRLSVTWNDQSQPDRFAPAADVPRTVIAWIWYPARPSQWSSRAQYVPRDWRAALAHTRGAWMMALFTRDLARVRVHSWRAPPVAPWNLERNCGIS